MPYIRKGLNMRYYWGKGIRGIEDKKFDLIVVNPPYIPVPPFMNSDEKDPYRGTGLIREILEIGVNKLNPDNPDACIIINVSSLAKNDLEHYIQEFGDRFEIEKIGSELRLPLKISTIDDKWRNWLIKQGLLEYEPDADDYKYWHRIQTYHIKPKLQK
jgi:methylase of polypeptide subunit release factors